MPRYRVLETSYINHKIVQPGEEVEYSGEVHKNLQPLDEPARKAATKPVNPLVENFVAQLKLHAAARGAAPTEVNAMDFEELTKDAKLPPDVVAQAAAALKVDLGAAALA